MKAALAQTAQEPDNGDELTIAYMSGVHRGKELAAQPAQEPVAWMREDATLKFAEGKVFSVGQPFYTTPQQRPWVGLTFAEICDAEVVATDEFNYFSELKFARAIEAKLKEKNT